MSLEVRVAADELNAAATGNASGAFAAPDGLIHAGAAMIMAIAPAASLQLGSVRKQRPNVLK
jgi:hypothetical protein